MNNIWKSGFCFALRLNSRYHNNSNISNDRKKDLSRFIDKINSPARKVFAFKHYWKILLHFTDEMKRNRDQWI